MNASREAVEAFRNISLTIDNDFVQVHSGNVRRFKELVCKNCRAGVPSFVNGDRDRCFAEQHGFRLCDALNQK